MKSKSKPFALKVIFRITFLSLILFTASNLFASTIQVNVFDRQGSPLPDIDVELLNDLYQMVNRGRTDGVGRTQFDGLRDGRYTIRVLAFRYDLIDQELLTEINTQKIATTQTGSVSVGNGFFMENFYLQPKKGGLRDAELSVVFAQEVPKEAESAYKQALSDFSKKKPEAGFENLKKSLEIFPTYYQALFRFGTELFLRKQYNESFQVFMKAVEVNPKSATSFYYLGYSFFNLGEKYHKAAMTSLNQSYTLAPASPQVLLLLGRVERAAGKFDDAEKHMLQAKKLSAMKVPDIHKELSQLYANDLKKYNEAADELELYLKASKLDGEEEKKTKKLIADLRVKAKSGS